MSDVYRVWRSVARWVRSALDLANSGASRPFKLFVGAAASIETRRIITRPCRDTRAGAYEPHGRQPQGFRAL